MEPAHARTQDRDAAAVADGAIGYKDGTPPTLDDYAKDVAAFLTWRPSPIFSSAGEAA